MAMSRPHPASNVVITVAPGENLAGALRSLSFQFSGCYK